MVENTGAVVVAAGTPLTGDVTRQLNVTVRPGVTIACTLTNTRATGTVTFVKATVGVVDPGTTFAFTGTGTGGVPNFTLAPGGTSPTFTIGAGLTAGATETANPNFSTTFSCTNGVTGTGTVIPPFVVAGGQNVVCTFTNTRLTGNLQVQKILLPGTDPGRFNIFADGRAGAAPTTGSGEVFDFGHFAGGTSVPVGETGFNTDLRNYTTTIVCRLENTNTVVVPETTLTGDALRQLNVPITSGARTFCQLTNTRVTGTVEFRKATVGVVDPGTTFAFTGTGTGGVPNFVLAGGGTTGPITIGAGQTAGATETANPNFSTTFSCTNGVTGTGTVIPPFTVAAGAERRLHLHQHPADGQPAGPEESSCRAPTRGGSTSSAAARRAAAPTTGSGQVFDFGQVPAGTTLVGETGSGTDLRLYTTTIVCRLENTNTVVVPETTLSGDALRQLSVPITPGARTFCQLTNTRVGFTGSSSLSAASPAVVIPSSLDDFDLLGDEDGDFVDLFSAKD